MLSVAIISKYPEGYLRDSIGKKLNAEGIFIDQIYHPNKITERTTFGNSQVVFVMHEMLSHSEYFRVKNVIERAKKKLVHFSRKSSNWNLKELGSTMASKKAVSDDMLRRMIEEFIPLRNSGMSMFEIAPIMSKYWASGQVSGNAFSTYLRSVIAKGRCPEDLRKPLEAALDLKLPKFKRRVKAAPVASVVPSESVEEEKVYEAPQEAEKPMEAAERPATIETEWQHLAQLYAEENEKLKLQIKKLERAPKSDNVPALRMMRARSLLASLESHLSNAASVFFELEQELKGN